MLYWAYDDRTRLGFRLASQNPLSRHCTPCPSPHPSVSVFSLNSGSKKNIGPLKVTFIKHFHIHIHVHITCTAYSQNIPCNNQETSTDGKMSAENRMRRLCSLKLPHQQTPDICFSNNRRMSLPLAWHSMSHSNPHKRILVDYCVCCDELCRGVGGFSAFGLILHLAVIPAASRAAQHATKCPSGFCKVI